MPYVVLARKYRPRGFEALLGQEPVVQALSNALARGRLHHAYLFTGTRGVGKTTVSRILAKALNCVGPDGQGGVTATPCGVCLPCSAIDAGRFVDYVELDAASNRGVDEMSQLLDQSVYKPVIGRYKVYLIDEVHMLSTTAFNAMLKTLEEPPEYLKFVLATTDPQKVPATVLSRCLQFTLRPLAPATVQAHLADVLRAEDVPAEAGALRLLARAARGSMRDALSLADQAIAHGAGRVSEAGVRAMLGTVDRGQGVAIVQALASGDGAALVALSDALVAAGLSPGGALDDLAQLLQRIAVLQAAPDAVGAIDPDDPDTAEARRLVPLLLPDEVQLYYSMALHGRAELSLAPDEHSGLVMALLRMLAFRQPGAPRGVATPMAMALAGEAPADVVAPAMSAAADVALSKPSPAAAPGAPLLRHTESRATVAIAAPARAAALPQAAPAQRPNASEPAPWDRGEGEASVDDIAVFNDVDGTENSVGGAPVDGAGRLATGAATAWPDVARTVMPTPMVTGSPLASPARPVRTASAPGVRPAMALTETALTVTTAMTATTALSKPAVTTTTATTELSEPPEPIGLADTIDGAPNDRWNTLVRRLDTAGQITALTRELAFQADCMAIADDAEVQVWRLRAESELLRGAPQRDKLERALSAALGRPVRLELIGGSAVDTPAMRMALARQQRQEAAERSIHEHPVVRSLLARYDTARIVPGSIKPL